MKAYQPQVSIGILAHNESTRIGKTLEALFKQDIFGSVATEVVIVANGCTDQTGDVATRLLAENQTVWSVHGSARVEELATAGKANAWNQFVHRFSARGAPILILMDADITLLSPSTLSSMVTTLQSRSEAVVCIDRAVKDIEIDPKRTYFQNLLLAATPPIDLNHLPLCGQLYCASSTELRQIELPTEIACDDGFLRALLLTEGFTKTEDPRRIILDSNAAHSFESVATLRELFKHEKWLVAGSIVNMLLFEKFAAEATPEFSAMMLMKHWRENDSDWLRRYLQQQVQEKGWRLLPKSWWVRRWSRLREGSFGRRLRRLPITAMAAALDYLIFIAAIRDVRQGRAFRYWGRT